MPYMKTVFKRKAMLGLSTILILIGITSCLSNMNENQKFLELTQSKNPFSDIDEVFFGNSIGRAKKEEIRETKSHYDKAIEVPQITKLGFFKKQQYLTTTGNDCSVFFKELESESNIYEGGKPSEHLKPFFFKNSGNPNKENIDDFVKVANTKVTKKNKTEHKPYNILWIVADDLGKDLGCYGNKLVQTPNLDKLASESVLFENLHTTTAVCSPSRSGLITGMYPVTLRVHQHRTQFKRKLPDTISPITEYFKEAGYFVTNGGADNKGIGKMDYNFEAKFQEMYEGTHWDERADGQPFFSQMQIFFPHRPFHRDSVNPINPKEVKLPPYYPDHSISRKDWALYLETVQYVDKQVGLIIERLEADGLLKNTIIFFFGDQGRPHVRAKQFLYNSGTNTPLMVRFPKGYKAGTVSNELISNIDIPAASLALANIERPLHMQGRNFISENNNRKYLYTMRDRRDETVDRIRAVRSKKFKYIKNYYTERPYTQFNTYKETKYPTLILMKVMHKEGTLDPIQSRFMDNFRPAEELYDLDKDPFEINNLADNPYYRNELLTHRKILDEWVHNNDFGKYPENSSELRFARNKALDRYKKIMEQRNLPLNATYEEQLQWWMKELLGVK
jgi:uncharacterized sulfatase